MNETATIPCRHFSEVKTLDSHRVSLHPGVQMGTGEFKAGGGRGKHCDGLASHPEGSRKIPSLASYYGL